MKRLFTVLLCLCLILTSFMAGCSGKTEEAAASNQSAAVAESSSADETTVAPASTVPAEKTKIKVSCWGIATDKNSIILKDTVDLFNQTNKSNTEASFEITEQEQYKTKIAALIAAGETPDVFNTWSAGFLKPYVQAGKVYDLTDMLNKDTEWKSRYVPGVYNALMFDGKVYGLPTTQTVVLLYYNKEIFDKYSLTEPKTYDDLKNIITVLNKNNVTPIALGNKAPWVGALLSELLVNRIGGTEPYDKVYNGTGTWEDPAFIEAGKLLQELIKMNAFPKGFNALDNDPSRADFVAGKAGMHIMGSWAIQQLYPEMKEKLGVCKFPEITGGKGNADSWVGQPDQSFAVSAQAKSPEAAAEFIKLVSDPSVQKKLSEEGNLVATNIELDPAKVNPVCIKANDLLKDMKTLFVFYDIGLGPTIGNEFNNTIQAITAGKSPEESFKNLQKFMEANKDAN